MKLKDIKKGEWAELSRYVDTVLIPLLPLRTMNDLADYEHLSKLEQAAEVLEENLKGRLLLWPTYTLQEKATDTIEQLNDDLIEKGFKYVFFLGSHSFASQSVNFIQLDLDNKELDFNPLVQKIVGKWS